MADVMNKVTKEVRRSVNTPDFPESEWVINPDLTLLLTVSLRYVKFDAEFKLVEMTAAEKAAVDAAVPKDPALEQTRSYYLVKVDTACEDRIMNGDGVEILGSGKKVSTSISAQIKWMGWSAIADDWESLGNSYPFRVRTKWDDDYVEINSAMEVKIVFATITSYISAVLQEAEVVKSTIQVATSIEEILLTSNPYLMAAPSFGKS